MKLRQSLLVARGVLFQPVLTLPLEAQLFRLCLGELFFEKLLLRGDMLEAVAKLNNLAL